MKKSVLLFALAAALSMCAPSVSAATKPFVPTDPVMPVAQVRPGMKAEVRTVLSGTKISSFGVTIVGVVPRKSIPNHLILIKVDDKKIRDNGGVAAGMSGSPVYVGKKLIGAFAYSWAFADRSLGLVTPIEEMTRAMNWPDKIPAFNKPFKIPSDTQRTEKYKNVPGMNLLEPESPDKNGYGVQYLDLTSASPDISQVELTPKSMPLQADGLSSYAVKRLKKKLGTEIVPLGASSQSETTTDLKKRLEPGSAMGVSLVWGDISMGGIGTLTAVDKYGRYLAFGHPMLERGAVAFPLTQAKIIQVIPSIMGSFKLGYIGNMIGIVTQDRPEAIGGYFGKLPPAMSYTVRFADVDNNRQTVKRFQTVTDPFMAPELGASGMLSVIDNEWNRKGEGTMMVKYSVSGGNLSKPWTYRNVYFSDDNLVEPLEKKFDEITQIFAQNRFKDITPMGIDLNVEVTREPRVVYIEKLEIEDEKKTYSPGDELELKVTLRPWRRHAVIKRFKLKVPQNAAALCEIDVRGGGIEPNKEQALIKGLRSITSLDSLLKELSVQESNNQIIAEIGGPETGDKKKSKDKDKKNESANERTIGAERKTAEKNSEEKENDDEDGIPKTFTDKRLQSEVQAEDIKNGTLQIVDTNYYVKGILRKFIKIKNDKATADLEMLRKLLGIKPDKPSKTEKKGQKTSSDSDAESCYFINAGRGIED